VGCGPRSKPLVSVVLTTRDRPVLLPVALACFRQQTYQNRELIIVDDGMAAPVSDDAAAAVGGRLLRVAPDTPLGAKLNAGIHVARGALCHKMDDDDWYAPEFLERMVDAWVTQRQSVCRPAIAWLQPYLVFDLADWKIRRAPRTLAVGATLVFAREDWTERPFRAVRRDDDAWFVSDQNRLGRVIVPVDAIETFLSVRHGTTAGNRGHTWTARADGRPLEQSFRTYESWNEQPETLLPDWALDVYRNLRQNLLRSSPSCSGTGSSR
jgi:glycosyltransferase involved in cell wall biosynthesis